MLTVKQPQTYGVYKSVHDLPTPPSASRVSPAPSYHDSSCGPSPSSFNFRRSQSPVTQPMSTPHRGLPPPAGMTLPPHQQQQQQQGPSGPGLGSAPNPHHHQQHHQHNQHHQAQPQAHHQVPSAPPPPPPPPPPPHHASHPTAGQPWSALPPPPPQWHGSEESMKNWLQTRAEEEKTRQEEERTRQEGLRLEQRKIEADMLRASLDRGIPPPMVPLVFAGMGSGGALPQAALEWAQQLLPSSQSHQLQLMGPHGGNMSPHHQRDNSGQSYSGYGAQAASAAAGQATGPNPQHPGSPIRARAQTTTTTTSLGGQSTSQSTNLPTLNTSNIAGASSGGMYASQSHAHIHGPSAQQEASPSIYFHHWQPPTTQAGSSSNRPGTPTGEASKKRKATATSQSGAYSDDQRSRSPTAFVSSTNAPSHSKRGHKRQRSDMSWYRPPSTVHDRPEDVERIVEGQTTPSFTSRERARSEVGKHSVSSLLSNDSTERAPGSREHAIDPQPQSAPGGATSDQDTYLHSGSSQRP